MARRGHPNVDQVVPRVLAVLAGGAAAAWVVGAIVMANRGIDVTDESFYLLSYRWWDSTPRTFTGVQYLYGPVFEALGHDVAGLRVFRLATVLVAHAWFARTFLAWMDEFRPGALVGAWRWAAGLAVVSSGGATYGWLPLSPGYNDVAALGSLVLLSCILAAAAAARATGVLPLGPAILIGPLVVALVAAKWASAVVVLAFLAVAAFAVLRSLRPRGLPRFVGVATASICVSFVGFGFLVGGFDKAVPPILEVNQLVARDTNSPLSLLGMYVESGATMLVEAAATAALVGVVAAVGVLVRRSGRTRLAGAVLALGPPLALVATHPEGLGLPGGGVGSIQGYTAGLVALSAVAAVALVVARRAPGRADAGSPPARGRGADIAVLGALLLLPAVQALGTGNSLYVLAVNQFACWAALLVVACAVASDRARPVVLSATACAVAVAATSGFYGLVVHPYRTSGFGAADVRIGGSGPLAPLLVSVEEQQRLTDVRRAVGDVAGSGSPVFAFDELPGVVLLVDGRSVGEAWYPRLAPDRTAAGIEDACHDGPTWGDRSPVVVLGRPLLARDRAALARCGIDLPGDFTATLVGGFTPPLTVYADRGSDPR